MAAKEAHWSNPLPRPDTRGEIWAAVETALMRTFVEIRATYGDISLSRSCEPPMIVICDPAQEVRLVIQPTPRCILGSLFCAQDLLQGKAYSIGVDSITGETFLADGHSETQRSIQDFASWMLAQLLFRR